ncbi:MAG: hypothetical protein R6U17_06690 [Thermoplasmata archaeon]
MTFSQILAGSMAFWSVLAFILVGPTNFELYGILLLIGLLICRELSTSYAKPSVGDRMDIMIYVGVLFFIVVIAHRILSILEIV